MINGHFSDSTVPFSPFVLPSIYFVWIEITSYNAVLFLNWFARLTRLRWLTDCLHEDLCCKLCSGLIAEILLLIIVTMCALIQPNLQIQNSCLWKNFYVNLTCYLTTFQIVFHPFVFRCARRAIIRQKNVSTDFLRLNIQNQSRAQQGRLSYINNDYNLICD